ncbi:hypothetical protein, partial [Bacillus sp. FJAT-25509]|uniref:hypothetical protein n=1 Tax=Bacillus sp. FJAT-25509 TaxID=1712029 RepID=UPI001C109CEE
GVSPCESRTSPGKRKASAIKLMLFLLEYKNEVPCQFTGHLACTLKLTWFFFIIAFKTLFFKRFKLTKR